MAKSEYQQKRCYTTKDLKKKPQEDRQEGKNMLWSGPRVGNPQKGG